MNAQDLEAALVASGERSVSALVAMLRLARGPAKMTELALAVGHTAAAASDMIDRLVRHGLVSRFDPLPTGRLVRRVRLTPEGDDRVRAMLNASFSGAVKAADQVNATNGGRRA